jgi:hypothetical protein
MDLSFFRVTLQQSSVSLAEQNQHLALIGELEIFSQESGATSPAGWTVRAFITELTRTGRDSYENLLALARYGHFLQNNEIYVAALEQLDGAELMGNLSQKLAAEVGSVRRDAIFASIPLPTPGTSEADKAVRMQAVVDRMERMLDPAVCHRILGGLRDLKDEWYLDERRKYQECGGVDAYLVRKKQNLMAELERIQAEGGLYFSQPVTPEMLDFVRCMPEIGGGVRQGNIIYEVKIPYQAHEYVTAADDLHKRYAYCHCPWVRESLRPGSRLPQVSSTFCQCSLSFIKKPWEVIFDRPLEAEVVESVLEGGIWCKIAIHLPDDVLQE